jgi:hypothetical protein
MTSVDPSTYDVDPGRGWVIFAGAMLALLGTVNLVYGIAAIGDSHVFVRNTEYVLGGLNTWGWLRLVAGVAQIVIAFGVFAAAEWGRWLGVLATALSMLVQFLSFPSYPGLAVALFFANVLVLYGLLTYGGSDRDSLADWH